MSEAIDFYKLPFTLSKKEKLKLAAKGLSTETAKPYCRRVYLDLDFIEDLGLDITKLNIKAVYTATSLSPFLMVEDNLKINNYISLGSTLQSEKEELTIAPNPRSLMIGFKHVDKWKFDDGSQIGTLVGVSETKQNLKLQRLIQRRVLGFWRYWTLRVMRQI